LDMQIVLFYFLWYLNKIEKNEQIIKLTTKTLKNIFFFSIYYSPILDISLIVKSIKVNKKTLDKYI